MVKTEDKSRGDVWQVANNGEIEFCYVTAERDGIPKRAFRDAIDELILKGLIDLNKQGAGGRAREKNQYSISERWRKFGTPDFDPGKERIKNTTQGQGWGLYNKRKKAVSILSPEVSLSSDEKCTPKQGQELHRVAEMAHGKEHQKEVNS